MKHSSLSRRLEWERLALRDALRPDFRIYTGNDLAIDMVMYGSDYLLGLSTFAPEAFALRDRYRLAGDPRFFELNDRLQYLGAFAFRPPTRAYRHSAAQFLKLTGHVKDDGTPPGVPTRPESDLAVLAEIGREIAASLEAVEWRPLGRGVRVLPAALGELAGAIGAARSVLTPASSGT